MNKITFYILIFLSFSSRAQNYVYNPSFEIYDTCPSDFSQPGMFELNHAIGWETPTVGTSDYYNNCNITNVGTPTNLAGYQVPFEGNAYAGFGLEYDSFGPPQWYEYIQNELVTPLLSGHKYHICFYVSLAEIFGDYASSSIGGMISENGISAQSSEPQSNFIPQIQSTDFLLDTTNWMKIEGDYFALGGEKYLTIGYYSDPNNIDTMSYKDGAPVESFFQYYYIDNVSIEEVDFTLSIPNVITPNNDLINDEFELGFPYESLVICNRWGNKIFESQDGTTIWEGKDFAGKDVSEGTYYYKIQWLNQIHSGFVQVVR